MTGNAICVETRNESERAPKGTECPLWIESGPKRPVSTLGEKLTLRAFGGRAPGTPN